MHSQGDANYGLCGFAESIRLLTDDDGDSFQPNLRLVDESIDRSVKMTLERMKFLLIHR